VTALEVPDYARVTVPSWFWGGSAEGFFQNARLRYRAAPENREYLVRTDESYAKTRPGLVIERQLLGPGRPSMRLSELTVLSERIGAVDRLASPERTRILRELDRRHEQRQEMHTLVALCQAQTQLASPAELPTAVGDVHAGLLTVGTKSRPDDEAIFQDAGVHLVRRDAALLHRLQMAPAWLRIRYDPNLAAGGLNHLVAAQGRGDDLFATGRGLARGVFTLDAYLGPLLAALSPSVWAFAAYRAVGAIIYTLGQQPLAGTQGDAAELLQTLTAEGAAEPTKVPRLSRLAAQSAVTWWCARLDDLFGVLTDPVVFVDASGKYHPPAHLQGFLTVEQLFRRTYSIQTTYRDSNARRVLLFSVLDTLETLTGKPLETLCSVRFAEKTLALLEASIPADAAEVLLPAARRGVDALRRLQLGFFIAAQSNSGRVSFPDGSSMDLDHAAAAYIKILRDATHGHGTNRPKNRNMTEALLANHDGKVHHDLALLGHLYLVDFLKTTDVLKRVLERGRRQ
jgi:hypothetical protein